jgi:hypothetical protein
VSRAHHTAPRTIGITAEAVKEKEEEMGKIGKMGKMGEMG